MNNVDGVHPAWGPKPIEPTHSVPPDQAVSDPSGVSDVVEISAAASLAAKIQDIPPVRADLVARVKQEIDAGTYETPERVEIAIDRLLDDLFPDLL